MLTLYTKERLSRRSLSIVPENQEYKEQKLSALEILKTLKPGELQLDDDDSGSDMSDPFEDIKDNLEKGLQKARKKLSRMEKNLELMQSFSEDFKQAMDETRKELKLESSIYYEDIDEITSTLSQSLLSKPLTASMESRLHEILSYEESLRGPDPDPQATTDPAADPAADPEASPEAPAESLAGTECDDMSGVWRMLDTSKGLIATPPFYNAYRQQAPHWLDRPEEDTDVVDGAREKCVQWLEKLEGK